jgi:hypothetical protein
MPANRNNNKVKILDDWRGKAQVFPYEVLYEVNTWNPNSPFIPS